MPNTNTSTSSCLPHLSQIRQRRNGGGVTRHVSQIRLWRYGWGLHTGARTRRAAAQCGLPRTGGGGVERSETEGASPVPPRAPRGGAESPRRRGLTLSPLPLLSRLFPLLPKVRLWRIAYCLLPLFLLTLPACVHRKIRVTSTPPGARVLLNDQDIGTTPVETRFTFYGGYDVQLIKPGYEHVHELKHAKAPLHEYPVVDLAATAIPADFDHTIQWHFDLTPVPESTDPEAAREALLDRAATLREQARTSD